MHTTFLVFSIMSLDIGGEMAKSVPVFIVFNIMYYTKWMQKLILFSILQQGLFFGVYVLDLASKCNNLTSLFVCEKKKSY